MARLTQGDRSGSSRRRRKDSRGGELRIGTSGYQLLARHNVAPCVHDMLPDHPRRVTADFAYIRYHGRHYAGRYSARALSAQAQRIREYRARGIGVHPYFNNDGHGYAVENARALKRYLQTDKVAANSSFLPTQPYQG